MDISFLEQTSQAMQVKHQHIHIYGCLYLTHAVEEFNFTTVWGRGFWWTEELLNTLIGWWFLVNLQAFWSYMNWMIFVFFFPFCVFHIASLPI